MLYMNKKIFISYANNDQDIVENLSGRLKEFNVEAWVYSKNKTLAEDAWKEIEEKILESNLFIYAISDKTPYAEGQSKELEIALKNNIIILPLSIGEPYFKHLPKSLRFINGVVLNAFNVKETTLKIINRFFKDRNKCGDLNWNYPIPGDWLEVIYVDENIEEYIDVGDKLYFRKISPLGLFECYSPKIKSFFCIYHEHVVKFTGNIDIKLLNEEVPFEYSILNMVQIQERAWRDYFNLKTKDVP